MVKLWSLVKERERKKSPFQTEVGDYWLKMCSLGSNLSVIFTFGLELFAGRNLKCKYFKSLELGEKLNVGTSVFFNKK